MATAPLPRLRRICLALPEAEERETWDHPTFRVRGRIFALVQPEGGAPAVWLKAPPGSQEILTQADPSRFFRPPYLGARGWIGLRLRGAVDWAEAEHLIRRSFSLVAPKRVAAALGPARGEAP